MVLDVKERRCVAWDRNKGGEKNFKWVSKACKDLGMGKLGVGSNKLAAQQTVSKSSLGPITFCPKTFLPRECSNNLVELISSANFHVKVGESSLVTPTSSGMPTQVAGGPVRPQKVWVQAENGGKSFSGPPRSLVLPIQVGESSSSPSLTPLALSVTPTIAHSSGLNGKSPDSPAVDVLEVRTNSNDLAAAPMECISAGFNSDRPMVAHMELNGNSSNGSSSDEFALVSSKIDMANSQLSKSSFLADIIHRLSGANFVDFRVNSVDKVGSVSSELLIQGVDYKGTKQIDVGESGQPNLVGMELKSGCGQPGLGVSMVGELAFSEMVSSEEENLADCNPLFIIIPPGLALTMEMHDDYEVLNIGTTLDVSSRVKNRIPGFSKVIGLSANRHEKLCIVYLQRLEREKVVINQQRKKAAANQKVASSTGKGKRELRNLISTINYDGR